MSSLDALVHAIEKQYFAHEHEAAMTLIEGNLAAAWYGFPPERFREMLGTIIEAGADRSGAARWLHTNLSPAHDQRYKLVEHSPPFDNPAVSITTFLQTMKTVELRLRGKAGKALYFLDELDQRPRIVQPVFDTSSGWNLLISVQNGITAMLAGEFRRALDYFAEAEMHVPVATLTFLHRDAHVKGALLHGLFGDMEVARTSLRHAATIPRTSSWAETLIDASSVWVSALLERDADEAVKILLSVPPRDVGEMWPFYVLTLQRVFFRAGRWKEVGERIATLDKLPFPRHDGEGLTGSVFPLFRAVTRLYRGDIDGARWQLGNADEGLLLTRMLTNQLECQAGRFTRAISGARGIAAQVNDLRQLQLWRYAILATSNLALNRPDAARESLKASLELSGEIREEDLHFFSDKVHEFAREHIDGWYVRSTDNPAPQPAPRAETSVQLTDREREILRLLARAASRSEIADQLFVSLNTLKSHLQKIYRKLGVSSRDAAVLRAEREGLI